MSRDAHGACKGFAFVNFRENREARECVLRYNAHPKNYLDGKHVVIEHAKAWDGHAEKKIAACSYGSACAKADCWFAHPAGWAFAKTSGTSGTSASGEAKKRGSGKKRDRRRRGGARWKSAEESAVEDALGGEGETAGEEARREGSRRRRRLTARRRIRGASARTARARTRTK